MQRQPFGCMFRPRTRLVYVKNVNPEHHEVPEEVHEEEEGSGHEGTHQATGRVLG